MANLGACNAQTSARSLAQWDNLANGTNNPLPSTPACAPTTTPAAASSPAGESSAKANNDDLYNKWVAITGQ